ncbi:TylF/MycF/NovP-related O-methyltransferase [Humibacter ginsengisoli]
MHRINETIGRMTGFQLRRVSRQPSRAEPAASSGRATDRNDPKGGSEPKIPNDFDDEMASIIRAVTPFTMTNVDKLHALITATRYVAQHDIPGDVVECGVWRGGSMHAVARALAACGDTSRELYLYDTFEGMTEPTEKDVRWDGVHPAHWLKHSEHNKRNSAIWAYASLDEVKAGFENVPYPKERLHFVQGPVEQTVPGILPERIALLRLDTDWHSSTAHELAHMYDRLVPGGVLLLDDYAHWQGAREAVDEWLERTGEKLLLVRMGGGRIAVKPGLES